MALSEYSALEWLLCLMRLRAAIDFLVSPGSAPLLDLLSIQTPWWAGQGLGWCRWKNLLSYPLLLYASSVGQGWDLSAPYPDLPFPFLQPTSLQKPQVSRSLSARNSSVPIGDPSFGRLHSFRSIIGSAVTASFPLAKPGLPDSRKASWLGQEFSLWGR